MATQIGQLFVKIGADTGGLTKGFAKAEVSTKNLRKGLDRVRRAAPMMVASLAAVGTGLMVHIVNKTMKTIDAQAKLARQLNASIKGLVTVQHAAEFAGVSAEQMTSSLNRLNKSLGDAMDGTSEQAEAFEKLGLSVEELFEMDADERIATISQALNDSVAPAESAAIAAELFGRTMGNAILELDAETIAKAAMEVEALGLAVDEVDAGHIERANDAMYTLRQVVTGLANRITVKLAPAIEGIAVAIKNWAVETRGFTNEFDAVVEKTLWGLKWIADGVWGLVGVWKLLRIAVMASMRLTTDMATVAAKSINAVIKVSQAQLNLLIGAYNTSIKTAQTLIKLSGPLGLALDPLMKDLAGVSKLKEVHIGIGDAVISDLENMSSTAGDILDGLVDDFTKFAETSYSERIMGAIEAARNAGVGLFKKPDDEGGGGGGTKDDDKKTKEEEEKEAREARLAAIKESLMTEQEIEEKAYAERMKFLEDAALGENETEQERRDLKLKAEQEHLARMKEIKERAIRDEVGISQRGWSDQLKNQSDNMKKMLSNLRTNLDIAFQENKAYQVAMATIDAYRAITESYRFGANIGGPALGAVMAAAAAAAQFQVISKLTSTEKGSGGAEAAPLVTSPITPPPGGGGGGGGGEDPAGGGGGGYATINIVGGDSATFTGAQVRDLIEQINEQVSKGMVIRVA